MQCMIIAELRVFVVEELSNSAEEHLRQNPSQSSELTKNYKNRVKYSCMFIQVQLKPTWFLLCFKGFYYIMVLSAEVVSIQLHWVSEVELFVSELFGGR